MGWVEDLRGKTIALDTAPLIFFIERRQPYVELLRPFFQAVDRGDMRVVTSTITLIEVLVHPLRHGDESLAHQYNDILLSSPHIFTVPVTPATAQTAAELRASSVLKTPDAIQLATAINHRADAFLTNDRDYGDVAAPRILRLRDLTASSLLPETGPGRELSERRRGGRGLATRSRVRSRSSLYKSLP
jgi:predicted nucleic acid-binding protein